MEYSENEEIKKKGYFIKAIDVLAIIFFIIITILIIYLVDSNSKKIPPDECLSIGSDLAVLPGNTSTSIYTKCSPNCTVKITDLTDAQAKAIAAGALAFAYNRSNGTITFLADNARDSPNSNVNYDLYYIVGQKIS